MNLWLCEWTHFVGYDQRFSAVVRAETKKQAIDTICREVFPSQSFMGPKIDCTPLEPNGEPGVIIGPGSREGQVR